MFMLIRYASIVGLAWLLGSPYSGLGATFVVTNTSAAGEGSLRQAILDANAASGLDTINFAIPATGVQTITPTNALPAITDPVVIDGTTQSGYAGTPMIQLAGQSAGSLANGLLLQTTGCLVQGLAINRFALSGIRIESYGSNTVRAVFLGTDPTGTLSLGNTQYGLTLFNSPNNRIGGTNASDANLLSGNVLSGILISGTPATGNHIEGNLIGTDWSGRNSLSNRANGVFISSAPGNWIGGSQSGSSNVISGNAASGVYITGATARDNHVVRNLIGAARGGTNALANWQDGITVVGSPANWIGGTNLGDGNLISGNLSAGVTLSGTASVSNVLQGNYIGTDITGRTNVSNGRSGVTLISAVGTAIGGSAPGAANLVSGNKEFGIRLSDAATTRTRVCGNLVGTDAAGTKALPNLLHGLAVEGTSNVIGGAVFGAGNLFSGNTQFGVYLGTNASANVILGNRIGVGIGGTNALPNALYGLVVYGSSNVIGGAGSGAGNLISGNLQAGLYVGTNASANIILGNRIGTDLPGTKRLANGLSGIVLDQAPRNTVGGTAPGAGNLLSGNTQSGIFLTGVGTSNNLIIGNFVGTDASGTMAIGNWDGVLFSNSPGNRIGGATPQERNLISGNTGSGVSLLSSTATNNLVVGNFIGSDVTGRKAVPNQNPGVWLGAPRNQVGGTQLGEGNLISANNNVGVLVQDVVSVDNVILGNWIGLQSDGTSPLGNLWHGIEIKVNASRTTIGGTAPGAGNRIANTLTSLYAGVRIRDGSNYNRVRGNEIFANALLGIDLSVNGVTANRVGAGPGSTTYANVQQNFPVLTSAAGRFRTVIQGNLSSVSNQTFAVDFYYNIQADTAAGGYGEGQLWLGAINVTTDAAGYASFSTTVTNTVPLTGFITATATDASGNTSEFGADVAISVGSVADSDSDGMPDDYELAWGFNAANPADAGWDADLDGFTNLQEYLAGTNPRDPADYPRLLTTAVSKNGAGFSFNSQFGKNYSLMRSTQLPGTWQMVATNLTGLGGLLWITDTNTPVLPTRFYRLRCDP